MNKKNFSALIFDAKNYYSSLKFKVFKKKKKMLLEIQIFLI